jgi:fluoride exporter
VNVFYIGIAGIAGSICRLLLSRSFSTLAANSFPWGTFACNMIGSFLLGLLSFILLRSLTDRLRLAINTGFIGSFTTFSAFSIETVRLLEDHAYGIAFGYAMASLWGGLACCYTGIRLGEYVNERLQGKLTGETGKEGGDVRE